VIAVRAGNDLEPVRIQKKCQSTEAEAKMVPAIMGMKVVMMVGNGGVVEGSDGKIDDVDKQ
jgi:hypothetical protein